MIKFKFFLSASVVFMIIIHCLTLSRSPLPWFDEVSFAIITKNLQEGTGLLWPEVYGKTEVLLYGPVYFWLQSQITGLFGWGPFQFRLLNFISSIGIVILMMSYANQILRSHRNKFFFVIALALVTFTDIVFVQNMHSGRMDLFSVFVFFSGFYLFTRNKAFAPSYSKVIIGGLLIAMSLLITPRVVFCFSLLVGFFLFDAFEKGFLIVIRPYLIIAVIVFVTYLTWIYIKFHSISGFVNYYLNDNVINSHIGSFTLIRYKHQIPVYLLVVMSTLLAILNYRAKSHSDSVKLTFGICLMVLTYIFLVEEAGPYMAMIMPFLYLMSLVVYAGNENRFISRVYTSLFIIVFFLNTGSFVYKFGAIAYSWADRSPAQNKIVDMIPKQANVVADFKYFYLLINNNNNFTSIKNRLDAVNAVRYQMLDFDAEYIMIADTATRYERELMSEYRKLRRLELTKVVDTGESDDIFNRYLRKFNYKATQNYNGFIYRVFKKK